MNTAKSAVMQLRADRRTPPPNQVSVKGIPFTDRYTYLGIDMDDCGDFKFCHSKLKDKLTSFKGKLKMTWAHQMPRKVAFTCWRQLMQSKFSYQVANIGQYSERTKLVYESFIYRSLKNMFHITPNPCK